MTPKNQNGPSVPDDQFWTVLQSVDAELRGQQLSHVQCREDYRLFLDFGDRIPEVRKDGTTALRPQWRIWLGAISWRVMYHDQYFLGSEDPDSLINERLKTLHGLRLHSIEVSSRYMDLHLRFEGGFCISTFLSNFCTIQWILYYPSDLLIVRFDLPEERERIRRSSGLGALLNRFERIETPVDGMRIRSIAYDRRSIYINLSRQLDLILDVELWRLEQAGFLCTSEDECNEDVREKLEVLRGLVIDRVECADGGMGARFYIGDYVLELFVASMGSMCKWGIYEGFSARSGVPFRCLAEYPQGASAFLRSYPQ